MPKLFIMDLDRSSAEVYGLIIIGTRPDELTSAERKVLPATKFRYQRFQIQGLYLREMSQPPTGSKIYLVCE